MDGKETLVDLCALQRVPYADGGRDFDGCDCYGIGWLYNRLMGRLLPKFAGITASDTKEFLRAVEGGQATWTQIDLGEQMAGDAVLLRRRLSDLPLHLGWIVDDRRVMSTTRATGVTFHPIDRIEAENRLRGIYRYECDNKNLRS